MEKNTVNKRPWVRFYHQDWALDTDVKNMTMQEVGVYWTLLVALMANGSLSTDAHEYVKDLGVPLDQPDRVYDLLTPRIRRQFHTLNCPGKTEKCSGWGFCNVPSDDPSRLYNHKLTKVLMEMDAASQLGRANRSVKSRYSLEEAAEDKLSFDFSEVIRLMPKRRVKGVTVGWDSGKDALKYITTQEEFDRLLAATRKYAATRRGKDPEYHIAFDKWVLTEYHGWAPPPKNTEVASAPAAAPQVAPAEKVYPPEWCRPPEATRQLYPGEKPPWILGKHATPDDRELAQRYYPDDDAKRAWWMSAGVLRAEVRQ